MPDQNYSMEATALQQVVDALSAVDSEARRRILQAAATFLNIDSAAFVPKTNQENRPVQQPTIYSAGGFAEDRSMTPKQFLLLKQPNTDIERVACLAFYLTHYRNTPHFKTLDISKLNTDAAQVKLSNPYNAVENAVKSGLLASATQGQKQISALGERFVLALPDREAAKAAKSLFRPKRKSKKAGGNETAK